MCAVAIAEAIAEAPDPIALPSATSKRNRAVPQMEAPSRTIIGLRAEGYAVGRI